MIEFVSKIEAQRMVDEALLRASDRRIEEMTDTDGERIKALEVRQDATDKSIEKMSRKVDEMHSVLLQAKGARWAVVGLGALGGFLAAKASSLMSIFNIKIPN